MSSKENSTIDDEKIKESADTVDNANSASDNSAKEHVSDENNDRELTPEEKLSKELEDSKKELEDSKKELEDQMDKYLRLSAEFDNFRKRTIKEKAEIIKNGSEKTITAILPVLDDFERALKNLAPSEEAKPLFEGIELIFDKFLKTLKQLGLEKIDTEGQPFDTDYHEAIAMVPAPEEDNKGKILDCVQTGYKLNDKVIRHSKVVVAQ